MRGRRPRAQRRLAWILLAALASLAAAGLALRPSLLGDKVAPVIEGQVYRSAQLSPERLAELAHELGLRGLLNLRGERPGEDWYEAEAALAGRLDLALTGVRLSSSRLPSRQRLRELVAALDAAPRPLLIHCAAGADRSGFASALAVLLAGGDVAAARREAARLPGGLGLLSRSELPQVLELYETWLAGQEQQSSADALRRFAASGYVPGFYDADLSLAAPAPELEAGQPAQLRVRVANRSPAPWRMSSGGDSGIHLALRVRALPPGGVFQQELRGATPDRLVAPGESLDLLAPLPALPAAGRYEIWLDLVDEAVAFFSDMGSEPLVLAVAVREPQGR